MLAGVKFIISIRFCVKNSDARSVAHFNLVEKLATFDGRNMAKI